MARTAQGNRRLPLIVHRFRTNINRHGHYLETLRQVRTLLIPFLQDPIITMEEYRNNYEIQGLSAAVRRLEGVEEDIECIENRENYIREILTIIDSLVGCLPQSFLEQVTSSNGNNDANDNDANG